MTGWRLARLLLGTQREGSRYFDLLPFSAVNLASVASRQAAPSEGSGRCRTSPRYEVPAASITVNGRPSPGKASETPLRLVVRQTTPVQGAQHSLQGPPPTLDVAEALH